MWFLMVMDTRQLAYPIVYLLSSEQQGWNYIKNTIRFVLSNNHNAKITKNGYVRNRHYYVLTIRIGKEIIEVALKHYDYNKKFGDHVVAYFSSYCDPLVVFHGINLTRTSYRIFTNSCNSEIDEKQSNYHLDDERIWEATTRFKNGDILSVGASHLLELTDEHVSFNLENEIKIDDTKDRTIYLKIKCSLKTKEKAEALIDILKDVDLKIKQIAKEEHIPYASEYLERAKDSIQESIYELNEMIQNERYEI